MLRRTADVVIPIYRDVEMTWACIESVLEHSGDALGRLLLVDDCGPDADMRPMLRALRDTEPRVRLLENEANLGFIASCNRGLSLRSGHAVVLNNDTRVTKGWLDELLGVLDESPEVGAVCPLSNNATLCSVPDYVTGSPPEVLEGQALPLDGLPRWTRMPTGVGFCLLFRGEALDEVGLFDPAFGRGYHEENDWCQRAQLKGYAIARANRALVYHLGGQSFGEARASLEAPNARRLFARYPWYLEQNRAFDRSPHARVAAIAVRSALGRLRLAVLGAPELEEAMRVSGRVELTAAAEADVVVAPACPGDDAALRRLLDCPGHLVVGLPAMDATQPAASHGRWSDVEATRAVHWAIARAALLLVASSSDEANAIGRLFDLPPSRIVVLPADDRRAFERLQAAVVAAVRAPAVETLGARGALRSLIDG